jgi:FixJ family two-component response regulator
VGHTVIPETSTVYIVEDDTSLRNAVRRLLRAAQYRVITFASAEEFYQSDFKSSPGCLLLDIRLPGISGFELREELLASGAQMPVIFITGHDRAGMEEQAMRLGATAYLRKPFDEEALLGAIALAMKSLYMMTQQSAVEKTTECSS